MDRLPDITSNFKDFQLGQISKINSGTFAIIGFSKANGIIKVKDLDDAKKLGVSRLGDTVRDLLNYVAGSVYCYSLPLKESNNSFKEEKINNPSFSLEVKGTFYKDTKLEVEIIKDGSNSNAVYVVSYNGKSLEPSTVESGNSVTLDELGIQLKLTLADDAVLKKGEKIITNVTLDTKVSLDDLAKAHEEILGINEVIEYIAYDFNSNAVHWSFVDEELNRISKTNKKEFFAVFRYRNLDENEIIDTYISELEVERAKLNSIRILVVAQPVIYKNYYGELIKDIPLGLFCGKLSSIEYYESLNSVSPSTVMNGIISLSPFKFKDIEKIATLGYTGFRYVEGFEGIYITEAQLLSSENSDFDSVERIRVMNRASIVARRALINSFLNKNFEITSVEDNTGFVSIVKEIIGKAFSVYLNRAISKYEVEVLDMDKILQNKELKINFKIVPLGKVSYINNTFSFALEN